MLRNRRWLPNPTHHELARPGGQFRAFWVPGKNSSKIQGAWPIDAQATCRNADVSHQPMEPREKIVYKYLSRGFAVLPVPLAHAAAAGRRPARAFESMSALFTLPKSPESSCLKAPVR